MTTTTKAPVGKLVAIVTGGRDFKDRGAVFAALDAAKPSLVLEGACVNRKGERTGVDMIASEWAHRRGVALLEAPALWGFHDKAAGPIRNKLLCIVGRAVAKDLGWPLAVLALPGDAGTANMVGIARKMGIDVREHDYDGSVRKDGGEVRDG